VCWCEILGEENHDGDIVTVKLIDCLLESSFMNLVTLY